MLELETLEQTIVIKIKETMENEQMEEDEMKKYKEMSSKRSTDYVGFAKLIIFAYDSIENTLMKFENNSSEAKQIASYLSNLESITQIDILKNALHNYGYGENLGDHNLYMDLVSNIENNKKIYLDMCRIFFKIFEEE